LGSGRRIRHKKQSAPVKPPAPIDSLPYSKPFLPILSAALLLATFAAYSGVVHNSFVNFDDSQYISGYPEIWRSFDWTLVGWAFTTYAEANWHPLTWLSHALDYQLFQEAPAAVHLENVLLHGLSAVVLFLLLQRATGSIWRSLTVGALYALHPLNVESVAWAAERKNVLSAFFFMLALWAYGRYAQNRSIGRYMGVVAAFALGLMAKPQIVTFPFILLLWDVWPLGLYRAHPSKPITKLASSLILEKIPLFLLSLASCIVTMKAQTAGGAVRTLSDASTSLRLANAVVSYVVYLGKVVWPFGLAVVYPFRLDIATWRIAGSALLLLAISIWVLVDRRRPYLPVGWCWFLGTLVPMIGIVLVGNAALADRYAYLPAIGLFIMATWRVGDWVKEHQIGVTWPAVAAAGVFLFLGVLTYRQVGYWHDSESLWTHTLEVTEDNFLAHEKLGSEFVRQGRREDAMTQFHQAAAINPDDWIAQIYIGVYEREHQNYRDAIEHLQVAAEKTDNSLLREDAYVNLGTAYRGLHDFPRARQSYQQALSINPANPTAVTGLGLMAQKDGKFPEAIQWYSRAMRAQPNAVVCLLLARAQEQNGQLAESKATREKAVSLVRDINAAQRMVDQILSY